ncbi:hypothetical protein EUGRSUZ_J01984 [Eucalyptus grandis]|uniref:non-specific serine/threonine protein kinase n=2 Tax=Eucalyptus grandis TaxID=71139 RepID=A0A059AFJ8_EUCGR|nr:hypothetical protein EUGRSUZ_J01984 [Eucalyptus grandis]
MKAIVALSMCLVLFSCNALVSNALDTITTNKSIQDGESLISAGGTFELGFFSRGDPPKRYLGIWFKKITTMTIVWVANRVAPLADASSTLRVTSHGSLVLFDGNGSDIWSSNLSIPVRNPVAQLLDSGNLVVRDAEGSDPNNFLWQSFDYPTDTLLAGMKIGRNRTSGFNRYLTSWKSIDDPSPGNFTFQLDPNGYPQELLKQGSDIKFRTGPWNGLRWSGTPYLNPNPYYGYEFVLNEEEMYYRFLNKSVTSRLVLMTNGIKSHSEIFANRFYIFCAPDKRDSFESGDNCENKKEDLELPLFDLSTVAVATNYFSTDNKIGEGGFGPVYKGVLRGGKEIAVKMLSRNSRQGLHEFKNEVLYVSKLQHRNLVKLLGCCIEEENLLIYEFMPNRSLDLFLFDPTQRKQLDWSARFNIINGIARGLLYLHQDSRLRIIHRDVKASNVLLDCEMNPKISDFGLAKSFAGNETQANTNKVVGTYGYMSPEYVLDGVFSTKSDVFSYGVLVLEIVSGKRNRGFHHPDHHHNLLGHVST